MLAINEDSFQESVGVDKQNAQNPAQSPNLLSADQLLLCVLETAHNVGRMSVCTAHDASYKETANQCESLLKGKQQKMSNLINKQGTVLALAAQFESIQTTTPPAVSHHKRETLLSQDNEPGLPIMAGPCASKVHGTFKLPASSSFDNFLKAAGC